MQELNKMETTSKLKMDLLVALKKYIDLNDEFAVSVILTRLEDMGVKVVAGKPDVLGCQSGNEIDRQDLEV